MAEEIWDLARHIGASFYHLKHSANSMADTVSTEGVRCKVLSLVLIENPLFGVYCFVLLNFSIFCFRDCLGIRALKKLNLALLGNGYGG